MFGLVLVAASIVLLVPDQPGSLRNFSSFLCLVLSEQQGHGPLTVGELVARLSLVDANLPWEIERYDGTADRRAPSGWPAHRAKPTGGSNEAGGHGGLGR